jgi:hypothetical protein
VTIQLITKVGQVRDSNSLVLEHKDGSVTCHNNIEVLFEGHPSEEIIYRKKKNHYFLMDNYLNKKSHVLNAYIVRKKENGGGDCENIN